MSELAVIICGTGIAGAEGALRLRRLAGDRCTITILDPGESFAYRPLAVREPFAMGHVRHYPIDRLADDIGARRIQDGVAAVDVEQRTVQTAAGLEMPYDALLLALGGRQRPPYEHAHVFTDRNAGETFHGIVQDIEGGYVSSIVLLEPEEPTWPLPLYELALLTAERARSMGMEPQITLCTPHERPLHGFGGTASDAVQALLEEAGITVHSGVRVRVLGPRHAVVDDELELRPERIVTLPAIVGPILAGVPSAAPYDFVPIDAHCAVRGAGGAAFAAGDGTDFPIKHGGVAAQQADTAAAGIAHLAGVGDPPAALRPVLRGMLLTGGKPLYLSAQPADATSGWQSQIHDVPPWPADEKIIAEELGPYLAGREQAAPRP